MNLMSDGKKMFNASATGIIISLLRKEPLVIAQRTGISREARKPVAFSAFTARSSPKIPAVLRVATLLARATSSIKAAMSSSTAIIPEAINYRNSIIKLVEFSMGRKVETLDHLPPPPNRILKKRNIVGMYYRTQLFFEA